MKIAIACDHRGYTVKQKIIAQIADRGHEYVDFGTDTPKPCDYPDFAHPLAEAVSKGEFDKGITLCGSGNGINITANKHQGIRSAICWLPEIAMLARQHNDANICALPARYITDQEAIEIIKVYLATKFEGGRHLLRINKIPV